MPVPDIAAGPPTVSDDRLTYTFKLRPDVKYAPPVDRAVKADDFIYAVERQYDKQFPSPNPYNSVFKGAEEFGEGKADSISGLKAVDDTTLEITLTQPASDFLSLMATNFYAPVPEECLEVQAADRLLQGLPRRRPLLPRELDAEQVGHLRPQPQLGRGHATPCARRTSTRSRCGSGSTRTPPSSRSSPVTPTCRSTTSRPRRTCSGWSNDATLSKQFTAPIDGCTRYLTLQTDNGPTAKLEVRQAINYAIDKQAIVRAVGGSDRGRPGDHDPHPAAGRLPEVRPVPHARQPG